MQITKKVETALTNRILSGVYRRGEKIPSIRELSRELDASYVIVFRAIRNMRDKGLLESKRGTGIFVTGRSQRTNRAEARDIAFIFADPVENPREEYQLEIYTYAQTFLRERGYVDLALRFDENRLPRPENIAGAIVSHKSPLLPWFRKNGVPVVYCSSLNPDNAFSSVSPDFYRGSYDITEYLISEGHRKIGLLSVGDSENQGSFISRCQGYTDAMSDHGLKSYPPLPWHVGVPSSREKLERMIYDKEAPSALFVTNDVMGVEVISTLQKMGLKIPEDISVAGFEDMRCSQRSHPSLTTVSYDKRQLALETVSLLDALISGKESGIVERRIPMKIVIRDSVRKINSFPLSHTSLTTEKELLYEN